MSKKDQNKKNRDIHNKEEVLDVEPTGKDAGSGEDRDDNIEPKPGNGAAEKKKTDKESAPAVQEDDELAKLRDEVNEMKEKYLRLYSEFENYRKRNARERVELISNANADLIVELLPVLDDFERAEEAVKNGDKDEHAFKGFELIHKRLRKTLQDQGLKEMEDARGSEFDTEYHEAVAQFPVEDEKLKGKIYDVVEKGYFLNDKVIRFAKVVTGS